MQNTSMSPLVPEFIRIFNIMALDLLIYNFVKSSVVGI